MRGVLGTSLAMLARPGWASGTQLVPAYERAFARTILAGGRHTVAFGRGRVALWTILQSLGVGQGSEVILPAYTCETVPMAVKFAGAKCVYVDTEPGCYNPSLRDVARAATRHTRAIICQHTYGIVQRVQDWARLAAERQAVLIEDRCQLVENACADDGRLSGSDAAYFSTHFSKPFSTTQGGMAVFHDSRMSSIARGIRDRFAREPDRQRARSLAVQTFLYALAVRPATRAFLGGLYRWAQRAGLTRGSTSTDEYDATMPADYLSRATNLQAVLGMAELSRWGANGTHRARLTAFYLEQLERFGVDTGGLRAGSDRPALLMVPVLVENKARILRQAMRKGLPLGTWFDRPPAHLQEHSAPRYDYTPGRCPHAEYLTAREIHLLTAPWVSLRRAQQAIGFVERYARLADPFPKPSAAEPPRLAVVVPKA
jgi:perosamine synthetase